MYLHPEHMYLQIGTLLVHGDVLPYDTFSKLSSIAKESSFCPKKAKTEIHLFKEKLKQQYSRKKTYTRHATSSAIAPIGNQVCYCLRKSCGLSIMIVRCAR